jgi:hypothetical protein
MDADKSHSEKQPEHMATGTAENQEQPLSGHKLWSPVQQHRVFDLTAQARHLKKKNCIMQNGNVVSVLTVKAYMGNGGLSPLILNLTFD